MKYRLRGKTYVHAISDFFIQYRTGNYHTEESYLYVHGVNGLGQSAEWHVWNFWMNEILTASPAATILHSSAVSGYKMHSPYCLQRWKTNDIMVVNECNALIRVYMTVRQIVTLIEKLSLIGGILAQLFPKP